MSEVSVVLDILRVSEFKQNDTNKDIFLLENSLFLLSQKWALLSFPSKVESSDSVRESK